VPFPFTGGWPTPSSKITLEGALPLSLRFLEGQGGDVSTKGYTVPPLTGLIVLLALTQDLRPGLSYAAATRLGQRQGRDVHYLSRLSGRAAPKGAGLLLGRSFIMRCNNIGRPSGTWSYFPVFPALKRWAKLGCPLRGQVVGRGRPAGADFWAEGSFRPRLIHPTVSSAETACGESFPSAKKVLRR